MFDARRLTRAESRSRDDCDVCMCEAAMSAPCHASELYSFSFYDHLGVLEREMAGQAAVPLQGRTVSKKSGPGISG